MKTIFNIVSVFLSLCVFAQVGIGTQNPATGASLEVNASDKGALLPRVSLTDNLDQTTIQSPAKGLIVYNIADSGSGNHQVFKNSFYFWNGIQWDQCVNSKEFQDIIDNLRIPKLATYMYKNGAYKYVSPTGDNVVNFNQTNNVYRFSPFMDFNINDPNKDSFRVLETGDYGFEGFVCTLLHLSTQDTVHPEVVIQKSTDEGATWTDTPLVATAEYDVNYTAGLTIPINLTGVVHLNQNDLIRMVVRIRFSNAANYSHVNYISIAKSNGLGVQYSAGFKAVYYP